MGDLIPIQKGDFDFPGPEEFSFFAEEENHPGGDFEVPEIYRNASFETGIKTQALVACQKFIAGESKKCLIMRGTNGCGKTHAIWATYRHLKHHVVLHEKDVLVVQTDTGFKKWRKIKERLTCSVLDSRSFYQEYSRNKYDERGAELIGTMKHAPLLAIDDFGKETRTTWNMEIIEEILDFRYMRKMPVIAATNLMREDIKAEYPMSLISRLQEWGVFLELKDKSLREHGGFDGKDVS